MLILTLGAKIRNLINNFKARVLNTQGQFEAESCLDTQLVELNNLDLLDNASLVVTPNGYRETLLYAVEPNEVGTNLFLRSEEFENAGVWIRQNILSISTNVANSPIGTLTADKIIPDTTLNQHRIFQSSNFLGEGVLSVYAKADGYNFLSFGFAGGVNGGSIYFNLSNGTISGTASGFTPSIENVGNGWYRCSIYTANLGGGQSLSYLIVVRQSATTDNYTGDGTSGILVWGAQLVQGTAPKDYFPTTNRQNVPRIDYSNGSCPSILVEPQRTNLLIRSEEFEDANWIKTNTTITSNTTISPSGNINADTYNVVSTTANFIYQNITLTTGAYGISVYAKKGTSNIIRLFNVSSTTSCAWFDLDLGQVIGTVNGGTASIENVGNGWYRCIYRGTSITSGFTGIGLADTANSVTASIGSSVFLWGAQLEAGTNATSYIPTVASTVTRNADVITNTNASTLIGQSEGSVYLEFYHSSSITANIELFNLWNGVSSYIIRSRINSAGANSFSTIYAGNGGILHPSFNLVPNSINKVVIIYDYAINTSKVFHNGVLIGLTVGIQPYPTTLQDKVGIGSWFGNANSNTQRQIAIWKTKLTDTQAIQLTTL